MTDPCKHDSEAAVSLNHSILRMECRNNIRWPYVQLLIQLNNYFFVSEIWEQLILMPPLGTSSRQLWPRPVLTTCCPKIILHQMFLSCFQYAVTFDDKKFSWDVSDLVTKYVIFCNSYFISRTSIHLDAVFSVYVLYSHKSLTILWSSCSFRKG